MGFLVSIVTRFLSLLGLTAAAVNVVRFRAGTETDVQPFVIALACAAVFWQLSNVLENK